MLEEQQQYSFSASPCNFFAAPGFYQWSPTSARFWSPWAVAEGSWVEVEVFVRGVAWHLRGACTRPGNQSLQQPVPVAWTLLLFCASLLYSRGEDGIPYKGGKRKNLLGERIDEYVIKSETTNVWLDNMLYNKIRTRIYKKLITL